MNSIFPVRICDEICDYNLYCSKCRDLNSKEYRNIKYNQDYFEDEEIKTVAEKQIHFFKKRMEASPIDLSDNADGQQIKREIDTLMNNPTIKKGLFLQATKSYLKKEWRHTYFILKNLHNSIRLENSWSYPSLDFYYEFRNVHFRLQDFFKLLLCKYTKELFKYYEHDINQDEINKHLENVLDNYQKTVELINNAERQQ